MAAKLNARKVMLIELQWAMNAAATSSDRLLEPLEPIDGGHELLRAHSAKGTTPQDLLTETLGRLDD
jgi:hypothetical protein